MIGKRLRIKQEFDPRLKKLNNSIAYPFYKFIIYEQFERVQNENNIQATKSIIYSHMRSIRDWVVQGLFNLCNL